MKKMKKWISGLLVLVLMLSVLCACGKKEAPAETEAIAVTEAPAPTETEATVPAETEAPEETEPESPYFKVGDKMEDFTVTTYDGREVSLYQILEEKDMVLLNFWATWCGPCGSEFPAMQKAYEKYQDKVEIIAVSIEPTDTNDVLEAYAKQKGMTFNVAADNGISSLFDFSSIPTTLFIDRFGTICLMETGSMTDAKIFTNAFEVYTAEDYTESIILPSMMSEKSNAEPSDPVKLGEVLNAEGGNLAFANSSNPFHWPMTVESKDGRDVVAATNGKSQYSQSAVKTKVDVQAGDVLLVEYKLDSDAYCNAMNVEVNGKSVKQSARSCDWSTYAYAFEKAGTYDVSIGLEIMVYGSAKGNGLWIDTIQVLSGDEAAEALAANPQYPVAEATNVKALNEGAKEAYLYDINEPDLKDRFIVCSDKKLKLLITLDESVDPENAFVQDCFYMRDRFVSNVTEDGFVMEVNNVTKQDMLSFVYLYSGDSLLVQLPVFHSEDAVNAYLSSIYGNMENSPIQWAYEENGSNGNVTYVVTYVDQNGDPVPGVMCQVCDEATCQLFTSDANGVCRITLPAKAYEIHTLKVPEGYEGDTTTITKAPAENGEYTFELTRK